MDTARPDGAAAEVRRERGSEPSAGSNFRYAFFFLPREKRRALEAFYAFSRRTDDIVDEAPSPAEAEKGLAEWREELSRTCDGKPAHPVTTQLAEQVLSRYPVRREDLFALLDGVETDLKQKRFASFEELEPYCYGVASAVGLVCIEIFGRREEATREYAVATGKALQLTNICRDVGADARKGRIYLPLDELARCGYSAEKLLAAEKDPAFLKLMELQIERARSFYQKAAELLPAADRRAMLPAEVMRAIYKRLLDRVAAAGYEVLERQVRLGCCRKLAAALRTWLAIAILGRTP